MVKSLILFKFGVAKVVLGAIILLVPSGCGERSRTEDCIVRHLNAITRYDAKETNFKELYVDVVITCKDIHL